VSQLNQTTQQNASSSEELAATAEEMSGQAEQLQQTMSFFRLGSSEPATPRSAPTRPRAKGAARPAAARTAERKNNGSDHAKANGFNLMPPDETQFTRY
jgi:methyl-accepting chemotaxis protein